ncbi:MAG: hypothetical protein AMXMBFR33_73120 [Candidatus Xenobia bacterium]
MQIHTFQQHSSASRLEWMAPPGSPARAVDETPPTLSSPSAARESFHSESTDGWRRSAALASLAIVGLGLTGSAALQPPQPPAICVAGTTSEPRAPVAQPRTALQKHVDFFDRNGDGQTRVWETYQGLRALKLGRMLSAAGAVAINASLGLKTGSPWYSWLTIQNDGIHMGKHEGDTDVYDEQGNFVQSRFNALFTNFDKNGDDALSKQELDDMMIARGNGKANLGSKAEFGLLLEIAGEDRPEGRVVTRKTLQALYDGSLFYTLAGEKAP